MLGQGVWKSPCRQDSPQPPLPSPHPHGFDKSRLVDPTVHESSPQQLPVPCSIFFLFPHNSKPGIDFPATDLSSSTTPALLDANQCDNKSALTASHAFHLPSSFAFTLFLWIRVSPLDFSPSRHFWAVTNVNVSAFTPCQRPPPGQLELA